MHRILLAVVIAVSSLPALVRAADTYKVDPEHATVIFRVSHLELGNAYGRFNDPTGVVVVDTATRRAAPSTSR